jgi:hypothetical protein
VEVGLFTGGAGPSDGAALAVILCINWRMAPSAALELEVAVGLGRIVALHYRSSTLS